MDNFKWFYKKKQELIPKIKINIEDLNVGDFNDWFQNKYSGYGGYSGSAKGIFLRLDKLSPSMMSDYFDYLNVECDEYQFMEKVRKNWIKKEINYDNKF